MGKRRHNVKGRQVNNVVVDNTETKKVRILFKNKVTSSSFLIIFSYPCIRLN